MQVSIKSYSLKCSIINRSPYMWYCFALLEHIHALKLVRKYVFHKYRIIKYVKRKKIWWYAMMWCFFNRRTTTHVLWCSLELPLTSKRQGLKYECVIKDKSFLSSKTNVVGTQKKPSQWDSSFEHTKQMFKYMD